MPVGSVGRLLPAERPPDAVDRPDPLVRLEPLRLPVLPDPELVDGVLKSHCSFVGGASRLLR